jgi:hypothetical protein
MAKHAGSLNDAKVPTPSTKAPVLVLTFVPGPPPASVDTTTSPSTAPYELKETFEQ